MMKPLYEWSLTELEGTHKHLESILAQVAKESKECPGHGWELLKQFLTKNRDEVQGELKLPIQF